MRQHVPRPDVSISENASIGVVCYGTSMYATEESRDQLETEYGVEISYLRLKAYPFTSELTEFIERHARIYVVEQNRDGQMFQLMKLDFTPEQVAKLRSVRYYAGLPLDARTITDEITIQEGL
ncbi:MAG: hypothetical protein GY953_24010 [bacterium]|nr:hypothetical protein [bacterium]